ncbi:MAG: M55 family metallopeptidase [Planctomycetota bacterium]|nr:M55 family metallopeptidase [Planctomycetota bacterium]MDA1139314.1 M55 family metallopeptidase [Planctomycetota bacterium]
MKKIFVLCDLEGTAGVVDFELQTYPTARYYDQAKRLATLEVNAVVDGILEWGSAEIVLLDGHGPGGLDYEHVHKEAKMMIGRPLPLPWLDESYDAMFLYGHHTMNRVATGVLAHSWSSKAISNVWLNDELIGEIGLNAAIAGHFGVPTVFISGDDDTMIEARRYVPNIVGVSVKKGLSRTSAISVSPAKARDMLHAGAVEAMNRIDDISSYKIEPPFTFRTEYLAASTAESKAKEAGIDLVGPHTVEFRADDLIDLVRRR